jgi:hypothetical protein
MYYRIVFVLSRIIVQRYSQGNRTFYRRWPKPRCSLVLGTGCTARKDVPLQASGSLPYRRNTGLGWWQRSLGLGCDRQSEPIHRTVLGTYISRHRNMLVAEAFLHSLILRYGKHPVYTDGGPWYPEACHALGLQHRLHSLHSKNVIERMIEYFKDRTEGFDDYYPCTREGCNLSHVNNWLGLFVFLYNARRAGLGFGLLVRLMGGDGMA